MATLHAPHIAKYFQLSQHLTQLITDGELLPNQQLPTEEVMKHEFSVSRGTVRKAVDLLETQGLVRREQGRGTFVTAPADGGLTGFVLSDFAQEMYRQQRQPSTMVLVQAVWACSAEIATHLDLTEGDPVIHIQRLRLADGQPIIFEERFLNADLCPELATDNVETQSIHWLLVHKYKLPLVKVTHTVEMREVGADSAPFLNLQPTDPVFAIDRLTYTNHNAQTTPAVYYRALCHGSEYQFKAQFNAMI